MSAPTINQIITALAGIAQATPLSNGDTPTVKDLDNTPTQLNSGEAPIVFFLAPRNRPNRLSFDAAGGGHHKRQDFTIFVFYIDQCESLGAIWESRPRASLWGNDFVNAVDLNDSLGLADLWCNGSADVKDGLKYNGIPWRGALITVSGYYFT